jgi:hypothetical protein
MAGPYYKKALVKDYVTLHITLTPFSRKRIYFTEKLKTLADDNKVNKYSSKDILSKYKIEKHNENYCKIDISEINSVALDAMRNTLLWDINDFNGCIAGGAILRLLFDVDSYSRDNITLDSILTYSKFGTRTRLPQKNYFISKLLEGDIDCFFTSEVDALNFKEYIESVSNIFQLKGRSYGDEWGKLYNGTYKIPSEEVNVTPIMQKIQLIVRDKGSPSDPEKEFNSMEDIIDIFDLSLSKVFIRDDYVFIHKNALRDLMKNRVTVETCKSPSTLIRRTMKYMFLYNLNEIDITSVYGELKKPSKFPFLRLEAKNWINPFVDELRNL